MLLTSSQVSIAISSGIGTSHIPQPQLVFFTNSIVFTFTSALFLSGYVIQQQTVRNLREAIKPKPRPTHTLVYLPPQFDAKPTTIVGDQKPSDRDAQDVVDMEVQNDGVVVEVKASTNEDLAVAAKGLGPPAIRGMQQESTDSSDQHQDEITFEDASTGQKIIKDAQNFPSATESPTERTKDLTVDPDSGGRNEQPIQQKEVQPEETLSRAARRKKIKEEIMESSEGEGPQGYRRRMW
jgi:hypothetical protein